MKKLVIIFIVLCIYEGWSYLNEETPNHSQDNVVILNAETPSYSQDNVVILYSTEWCGYCDKARNFFIRHNINYIEYDIEKSDWGRKQYDALNGKGIPLILINGSLVQGYREQRIVTLLK
ncbi:glutaredoxin family protein [Vibrio parahaemolyticus]|nr:glutaredoxin family protein [Vibrio parahaemolyticus]